MTFENATTDVNSVAFFQAWVAASGAECLTAASTHDAQVETLDSAWFKGSGATQFAKTNDLVVLADARIDNRSELLAGLSEKALPDDVHLILAAWEVWGADAVSRLYGDFAFVVFDRRTRTTYCVCDHIGAVPLWYGYTEAGDFTVATTPAAVCALPGISNTPNRAGLAEFIQRGTISGTSDTLLDAVKIVPPGHILIAKDGTAVLQRWWEPDLIAENDALKDEDIVGRLGALIDQAVMHRLVGVDRVALHLSGGLDSSAIALLAQREMTARGKAFDLGFAWQDTAKIHHPSPEHQRIESIAKAVGVDPIYAAATTEDMKETLARNALQTAVPEMLSFELPILRHCEAEGIQVILSGWGGDECASFSGRMYFASLLLRFRLRQIARHRQEGDLSRWQFFVRHALRPALRTLRDHFRPGQYNPRLRKRRRERTPLLSQELQACLPPAPDMSLFADHARMRAGLLTFGHIQRRIQSWAVYGADHGIRYRYPLLDRRVLEFALSIPVARSYKGAIGRWPMRQVVDRLGAPKAITYGDKTENERVDVFLTAMHAALLETAKEIRAMTPPPAGADWVNFTVMTQAIATLEDPSSDARAKAQAYDTLMFYERAFQVVDWALGADASGCGTS